MVSAINKNENNKTDILIAGVGGQGTILAGRLIARLAISECLDVKTAETHGMAQRGGSVVTHVRIADKVYAPLIPQQEGDYLLAFEKLEALRWLPYLKPGGTVIVNAQELEPAAVLTGKLTYPQGIAKQIVKKGYTLIMAEALTQAPVQENPRTTNTFLLGILARRLSFAKASWLKALKGEIKPALLEQNLLSFAAGWDYQA